MKLTYTRAKPIQFLRENLRSAYAPRSAWARHLPLWLRGFSSEQISLYQLHSSSTEGYFPEFFKYRFTVRTNQNVWPILHDKLLFDSFMRERLPTSRPLGVSTGSNVMVVQEGWTIEQAIEGLRQGTGYVVKPLRGGGGAGLHFVNPAGSTTVQIDSDTRPVTEFAPWFTALPYSGIYERLTLHEVFAQLYARTTNTLRVVMYKRKHHPPELLTTFLRVGVKRSEPVDNTNLGGIAVRVSTTGETDSAFARSVQGAPTLVTHHPDSGAELIGVKIPYWPQVVDMLTRFHEQNTLFDFVGWDVAITQDGPLVIEGNHNPSLRSIQFYAPLKIIPNFREFCEERGIL